MLFETNKLFWKEIKFLFLLFRNDPSRAPGVRHSLQDHIPSFWRLAVRLESKCTYLWQTNCIAVNWEVRGWAVGRKHAESTQKGDPGRAICSSRILRKTLQLKKRRDLKNLAKHEKQLNSFSPLKQLCHKARKYMDSINLMLSSMLCVMLVSDILFPLVT